MVQTTQPTIERAKARVEQERELISTERDAFDRFRSRLQEIRVPAPQSPGTTGTGAGTATLAARTTTPTGGLAEIKTAYRETVMAVPHYDREYGDTLEESLSAELGEELGRHVVDGQSLTPPLYAALVSATVETRDDRAEFVQRLDREGKSLRTIERELNDVESQVIDLQRGIGETTTSSDLGDIDTELSHLEKQCTDIANRRQELIHNRAVRHLSGVDGVSLVRYLYGEMETATPALHDIADCLDTIRHCRKRCLK